VTCGAFCWGDASEMADDLAGNLGEKEAALPSGEVAAFPATVEKPDMLVLLREMMESGLAQQTQHLAQMAQQTQRAVEDATHVLQREMQTMQAQGQRYTDESCARVKLELRETVDESCARVKEELQGTLTDIKLQVEEAAREVAAYREEVLELRVGSDDLAGKDESAPKQVRAWCSVPAMGGPPIPPRPLSPTASEEGGCECRSHHGVAPVSPPPAPRAGHTGRKPAEFDGKVSWEAYHAQFEILAKAQGWSVGDRALHLVASLRGQAVEVLGHLTPVQRASYRDVVEALRRRFGHFQQAEVHRARLKVRVRGRGEPLTQLAQEVESLVRRAYPTAREDMVDVLARDCFVDALQDQQLQIYVKQAHPQDVQEALARASEMEAFLSTTGGAPGLATPRHAVGTATLPRHFTARRTQTGKIDSRREASPEGFRGTCWGCGQVGHKRSKCGQPRRSRSLEDSRQRPFRPCCWSCGQTGHNTRDCQHSREVAEAGNASGLGSGAVPQPEVAWPHVE